MSGQSPTFAGGAPITVETAFVLLDDGLGTGPSRLLTEPQQIVRCDAPDEVPDALAAITAGVGRGLTAAGVFAYELGYVFEPRLRPLLPCRRTLPLIWAGLFARSQMLTSAEVGAWLKRKGRQDWRITGLAPLWNESRYRHAFARARDYLASGDIYQINLTFPLHFTFAGDPLACYAALRRSQRVAWGAVIAAPGFHVLSLSPELFLRVEEGTALVRPMKGTAARGITAAEDERIARAMPEDPKSRAENLMIVDLMRNDLGRIAEIGSVRVTDLFSVETLATLHQMTSGVTARLRGGIGLEETLAVLFPCGSVTGAPKIRAMEVIRELEEEPRGVYTGAIGMVGPGGVIRLNVAIRTLVLSSDGRGSLGVGSGLVVDSDAGDEYTECLLKARFLTEAARPFALIETLRWERGTGYHLLDRHLARLAASAAHFRFLCELEQVARTLEQAALDFAGDTLKVRLTLDADGTVSLTSSLLALPGRDAVLRYAISPRPVSSRDPLLYHKTSRRTLYEEEFARLTAVTGCDEVVFANERGELTEGSWTTLFVERGGSLLTPPVECGLLPGTLRAHLLETESHRVRTAVIRPQDLEQADRVWLGNSVRGLMSARLVAVPATAPLSGSHLENHQSGD